MKYYNHLIILITILACYSFLTCTELGTGVQPQTLPTLYRMMDPNYLPNDWYVNQTEQIDVRYFYHHLIIQINKIINNLEWTFLLLHIFSFVIFHLGVFFLTYNMFKNKKKSLFITLIIFIGYPLSLGATSFFKGNLSPNGIAWALIIFALYFYFKEKYTASFFITGLAALFSLADTLPVAGILIINLVLSKPLISKKKLINLFKSIPFVIISSFLIIPLFLINKTTPYLSKVAAEIVAYSHAKHVLPSVWTIFNILPFIFFFILFLYIFKKTNFKHKPVIKNFIWIIIIYCVIGTLFVEFYPLSLISKLMLFRTTKVISLFGYFILGHYLFDKIKESCNWLEKIFYFLFPLSFIYPLLIIPVIPIFLIINSTNLLTYLSNNKKIIAVSLVMIIILTIFFAKYMMIILPPERTTITALLSHIIFPAGLYLIAIYSFNIKKEKMLFIIATLLILTTLLIGPFNPVIHLDSYKIDESTLFYYIAENTPPNAVFLIPTNLPRFRILAHRAVVVDLSFPFMDKGIAKWYLRIQDISNHYVKQTADLKEYITIKNGYHSLTKAQLITLKVKYHFNYVIFEKPKDLNLKLIYENNKFVVYQI